MRDLIEAQEDRLRQLSEKYRKLRARCSQYCGTWNREDRNCEIYGIYLPSQSKCPYSCNVNLNMRSKTMREFTPEEKELIVNTEITFDCFGLCKSVLKGFELSNDVWIFQFYFWRDLIKHCEYLRVRYKETGDERIFTELIRLLPNSYKVVKL